MTRIVVVSTGGTIANTPSGRIGIDAVLRDIGARLPDSEADAFRDVEIREVLRQGAETFTPNEWLTIASAVREAADEDSVDGVVVTHGTYTAEETAYFLSLVVPTEKPLVVTCSQRKHGLVGNDGDRNLVDALRVARCGQATGKGVVLVINEEIHAAREVIKTNQRPGGFRSRSYGLLGSVEADRVSFLRSPTRRHTSNSEFSISPTWTLPRVDIASAYAGADGVAVDAFVKAGAKGIVLNGFAFSGRPHFLQHPSLIDALERNVTVVLTSRGGDGRVPWDANSPFVQGDSLSAQKARVLLSVALLHTNDAGEIQRIFDEY